MARPEPRHSRRIALLTVALCAVATPLVVLVLGPHLPPGHGSSEASGQVVVNTVILACITPFIVLLVVYFAYALTVFRARGETTPAIRGDARLQTTWVALTSALVLGLAAYGSLELLDGGAGGGQGPQPIAAPSGNALQVQVIGQQWEFTYRYPTFGGLETPELVLPVGRLIELHVTSLDAIHSFWAYGLGVKADANPGTDNIAYVTPRKVGTFDIRCAELCGLFHGYMFDKGRVVSDSAFSSWIRGEQTYFAPVARYLPKYSTTYFPDPQERAG